MQKSGIFIIKKHANLIGRLASVAVLSLFINSGYAAFIDASGYCLYHGDQENCTWCEPGGTQPGSCIKGYASCSTDVTVSAVNTSITLLDYKWTCTPSGWTSSYNPTPTNCDRYSYKFNGECVMCPYPDFKILNVDGTTADIFPRGDNWEYKLTGCNIQVNPSQEYIDQTGRFIFSDVVQCFHSGIL